MCDGEGPVNNDYANRDWPEMITGYYKPQWEEYLGRVRAAIIGGTEVGKTSYCQAAMDWSRRVGVKPAAPTMPLDQSVKAIAELE